MTRYVQDKIIEALKSAKGVRATARRRLAALCVSDQQFLLELVAPHLNALIDHAVGHYSSAELAKMSVGTGKTAGGKSDSVSMGEAMLRGFARQNTPVFGLDDPSQGTGKRPSASARHRAAIDKIAKRVDKAE